MAASTPIHSPAALSTVVETALNTLLGLKNRLKELQRPTPEHTADRASTLIYMLDGKPHVEAVWQRPGDLSGRRQFVDVDNVSPNLTEVFFTSCESAHALGKLCDNPVVFSATRARLRRMLIESTQKSMEVAVRVSDYLESHYPEAVHALKLPVLPADFVKCGTPRSSVTGDAYDEALAFACVLLMVERFPAGWTPVTVPELRIHLEKQPCDLTMARAVIHDEERVARVLHLLETPRAAREFSPYWSKLLPTDPADHSPAVAAHSSGSGAGS